MASETKKHMSSNTSQKMSMLNDNMASESTELLCKMAAQYDLDIIARHMCVMKSQVEGISSYVS